MHIWNRPWPFIYQHHNRVPMLLSVTFEKITLVWNFYWAHKFVARWIRLVVSISICGRFVLWPFRFVAVPVCGHSGLWPFRSVAFRSVAVPVCGRFGLWPFRFVAVSVLAVSVCGRYDQNPIPDQRHSKCNEIVTFLYFFWGNMHLFPLYPKLNCLSKWIIHGNDFILSLMWLNIYSRAGPMTIFC